MNSWTRSALQDFRVSAKYIVQVQHSFASSPNIEQIAVVLSAVEDTLREQKCDQTPTAYFAALLALLNQSLSPNGILNKELAASVVYLLDLVTSHVPPALLRSKFSQILSALAPTLTHAEIEAPLLRSSIGCLESLLVAQDAAAWDLLPAQVGPRRALAGLLTLAVSPRPKVRKRSRDAIVQVLKSPRLALRSTTRPQICAPRQHCGLWRRWRQHVSVRGRSHRVDHQPNNIPQASCILCSW